MVDDDIAAAFVMHYGNDNINNDERILEVANYC